MSKAYEAIVLQIQKLETEKRGMRIVAVRRTAAMLERLEISTPAPGAVVTVKIPKLPQRRWLDLVDKLENELFKAVRNTSAIDDLLDQAEAILENAGQV